MPEKKFPYEQVVVVGGTGQVGHRLLETLQGLDSPSVMVGTSREVRAAMPAGPLASTVLTDAQKWLDRVRWSALDLSAEESVLREQLAAMESCLSRGAPTALIIAAAYTNVEGCEIDPALCERINEINTREVLRWGRDRFDATLVFFSTDYVFDGKEGLYREQAVRHAESRYGQSKVFVEEWLEAEAPKHLILRTTGVFDYLPGSKNFLMQMLDLWSQGKTTRMPVDQYANPVWASELAKATTELLAHRHEGTFHVAGGSYLARTEFAAQIAEVFGFSKDLIQGIPTSELGQKAKRPLRGGLNCEKLRKTLGWAPAPARDVLESLKWQYRHLS